MQHPGSQFLHQRNPQFHASMEVETVTHYLRANGSIVRNEPAYKITAYLSFLSTVVNDGILTGDQDSIDYQLDAHTIRPDAVPDAHFELERRIAREQGHGDIYIPDEVRDQEAAILGTNQRESLNQWAQYLSSEETDFPAWFQSYVFTSVLKMGKLDKEKGEYQRRTAFTTAPYPELNRGPLSLVYDWLTSTKIDGQQVYGVFDDSVTESSFQKTLKSGDFAKLYIHAMHKTEEGTISPEQKKIIEGSWRTYPQHSDHTILHGDLQGFGLDWCTATGVETAKTHLAGGGFMVYFSRDNDGVDRIPRIAIRMMEDTVGEVRGIDRGQDLEPAMSDVALEKLADIPGGDRYLKMANDMRRLTEIEKIIKSNSDTPISTEDLRFLYEIDSRIEGFGYNRDPRIQELLMVRNMPQDMQRIYNLHSNKELRDAIAESRLRGLSDHKVLTMIDSMDDVDFLPGCREAGMLALLCIHLEYFPDVSRYDFNMMLFETYGDRVKEMVRMFRGRPIDMRATVDAGIEWPGDTPNGFSAFIKKCQVANDTESHQLFMDKFVNDPFKVSDYAASLLDYIERDQNGNEIIGNAPIRLAALHELRDHTIQLQTARHAAAPLHKRVLSAVHDPYIATIGLIDGYIAELNERILNLTLTPYPRYA